MKILISGASGFIGSNLTHYLAPRHDVYCLTWGEEPVSGSPRKTRFEVDISQAIVDPSLPSTLDAVIHLAQSLHYREFPDEASDIFDVNVRGTFNLLEYARNVGAKRFILASTGSVYGYSHKKITETATLMPASFYARSKVAAEILARGYEDLFHAIVLRFFFVYGPGQSRMLIPNLINKVEAGETVLIDGDPGIRINPIYIQDVCEAIEKALFLGGSETINICGDDVVSLTELAGNIGVICGKDVLIEHTGLGEKADLVGDNTRMKDVLNIENLTSLHDGLNAMTLADT